MADAGETKTISKHWSSVKTGAGEIVVSYSTFNKLMQRVKYGYGLILIYFVLRKYFFFLTKKCIVNHIMIIMFYQLQTVLMMID